MSQYQDDQPDDTGSQDGTNKRQTEFSDTSVLTERIQSLKKSNWFLKMSLILVGTAMGSLAIYAALVRAQLYGMTRESYEWDGKLGEDPSEFVPQGECALEGALQRCIGSGANQQETCTVQASAARCNSPTTVKTTHISFRRTLLTALTHR